MRNIKVAKYNNYVSKPELTAVIPVAKMAGRLASLESILRESSLLGIEVVIVHDKQDSVTGSEIEEIVKSLDSELVTVVTKSVFSPGRARNLGIERATGDWICFWDSDDRPSPEVFLSMIRDATLQGKEMALGKFRRVSNDKKEIFGTSETEVGRMPGIWRFAFKKESINGLAFPAYRMGEDQVFLAEIIVHYEDFFKYDKIVYEYVCGNVDQLTNDSKAILELEFAIQDMLMRISQSSIKNRIHSIFLSRQILTTLKHGNSRLKLKIARFVVKALVVGGKDFLSIFFNEFMISLKKQLRIRRNH
jgi:glycosyltransferase involved in cell wall biosynthesis